MVVAVVEAWDAGLAHLLPAQMVSRWCSLPPPGFLPLPVAQQKGSSCPSAGSEQPVPRPPIPLKMKKDGRQGHRAGSLGALAEGELSLEVSEAMGGCGREPRPGSVYRCGWDWLVSEHDSLRIDPRL